ncbi:ImmA/IrrE family metallo-endopeptidase [Halobacillus campisalis]|uniref:ImmA/IrrE family metallo-endopeptidase n=1 Tax=Halobacillus campisalis TaxID=435909 RepID=A0ABW2JZJ9_9BACI|nr:ImmA/IrrE family metallo-endopeptidase [Halobacillus campisalis]
MNFNGIKFDPYNEPNIEEAAQKFNVNFSHAPYAATEELAKRIFFDNSYDWKTIIKSLCERQELQKTVLSHFKTLVLNKRVDILPQYTYLLTFLISNNKISIKQLDKGILKQLGDKEIYNKDSYFLLHSFLASWDLNYALSIDRDYVEKNFSHIVEANRVPLRDIISNSQQYYKVLSHMLSDDKIQFHINQTIQKMIRDNNSEELEGLEWLINKFLSNKNELEIEFIFDALELSSIRKFLLSNWSLKFTEKLYNYLSESAKDLDSSFEIRAIKKINRLRAELPANFYLAARHEINRLAEQDKEFIVATIERVSSLNIEKLAAPREFLSNANDAWEWYDYANALVHNYYNKYPGDETIDIRKLVNDLNFTLVVNRFETEQFDACLVRDSSLLSPIIFVNTNMKSEGRINFSIAHELAHAIIPHHSNKSFFCFIDDVNEENKVKMDKHLEKEANSFASNILLPNREFKKVISTLNYNFYNIIDISRRYKTSIVLVAKKWVEESNLEIAMVFSTNGKVDWAIKSDTFPFGWIDNIPSNSSVHKVMDMHSRDSIIHKSNSSNWFETPFEKTILEESIIIFENKILTLLQIIED